MAGPEPRPYGSWPTPIGSELVVRAAARLGELLVEDDAVWWSELRPEEGGRTQLVRWHPDTGPVDVLPEGFNARTAVHEYGGAAWWVRNGILWFANWSDQRLYRLDVSADGQPRPIAPAPQVPAGVRWADADPHNAHNDRWIVAVRETHPADAGPEAVRNELVAIDAFDELPPRVLVSGPDFVSDPRWSPDGESLFQPRWASDGSLWFVSDRSGWWNLYRWTPTNAASGGADPRPEADARPQKPEGRRIEPIVQLEADIGVPQWVFGQSRYAFLDDGRVVFAYQRDGFDRLAVRLADGTLSDLELPSTSVAAIHAVGDQVVYIGASPTTEPTIIRLRLDQASIVGEPEILRPPRHLGLDPAWLSTPEPVSFPSRGGRTAHALFYPPHNPEVLEPHDAKPPLLVLVHGGPTGAARPMLQLATQYWTSRGFAVVDVNYGGSTGYGRAYRERLHQAWGVVDVDDCEAAALWLAEQGRVDPHRLCIRGGSAGGYTTLAALAFRDTFSAGVSHYGVADLEALARDTHKFESRYLDGLVGPYPAARDVYVERSPVHHVNGFDRPLAVFQGLEDRIVPPNQAEMIVGALRRRGVPVAYVAFEGEQHGFRQAANIRRLTGNCPSTPRCSASSCPLRRTSQPSPSKTCNESAPGLADWARWPAS
jgi:dipeptidyl aminopeptidase/acylaminoacyl peptidase